MVKPILTVIVLTLCVGAVHIYGMMAGPFEATTGIGQLNGTNYEFVASRALSQGLIKELIVAVSIGLLLLIWLGNIIEGVKKMKKIVFGSILVLMLVGCGPAKVDLIENVLPSETAFLVSLVGDTKAAQDMFKSAEYLEKQKIAAKQVKLSQDKKVTGRMPWDYQWIPTEALIKVSRAPITREWTSSEKTGTASKDQAIHVESKDSIGFAAGVNLTASIQEKDTATYLYKFAGKPFEETIDSNVRSFIQSILSVEFGARNLTEGIAAKKEITEILLVKTQEQFLPMGITIDYVGLAEGLTFDNKLVQESLDAKFKAEVGVKTAEQEAIAQEEKNKLMVSKAKAEREAAEEFQKALNAFVAKNQLEIMQSLAKNWNGILPQWLMVGGDAGKSGSGLLPMINIPAPTPVPVPVAAPAPAPVQQ